MGRWLDRVGNDGQCGVTGQVQCFTCPEESGSGLRPRCRSARANARVTIVAHHCRARRDARHPNMSESTRRVGHRGWPIRRIGPGLHRRLGGQIAMTDGAVVDVPGGEAVHAVTTDGPDVLAVKVDMPNPRGMLCQRDVGSIRWLHDGELDSVVLIEGHGPPRFESGKW